MCCQTLWFTCTNWTAWWGCVLSEPRSLALVFFQCFLTLGYSVTAVAFYWCYCFAQCHTVCFRWSFFIHIFTLACHCHAGLPKLMTDVSEMLPYVRRQFSVSASSSSTGTSDGAPLDASPSRPNPSTAKNESVNCNTSLNDKVSHYTVSHYCSSNCTVLWVICQHSLQTATVCSCCWVSNSISV